MRFQQVCIESLGYTLPEEILSSDEIERRLAPLYQRLRLPEGRLELMSGIKERRLWPKGTRPSEMRALKFSSWPFGSLLSACVPGARSRNDR